MVSVKQIHAPLRFLAKMVVFVKTVNVLRILAKVSNALMVRNVKMLSVKEFLSVKMMPSVQLPVFVSKGLAKPQAVTLPHVLKLKFASKVNV